MKPCKDWFSEHEDSEESPESEEWMGPWGKKPPWEWAGPWGHHRHHDDWGWSSPPWERWHRHRRHHRDMREWRREWRRKRGGLFFRFVGAFGCITVLLLGGVTAAAFALSQLLGGDGQTAALLVSGGCGLALLLPLLAGFVARRVFQDVTTPLADVMSAVDAVAEGDLSTRVEEPKHGPGRFSRLARSFNRMVEELERTDQQRRNLTADVAHELRNPLHIIQGNLEGVLDGVYQPSQEHVEATLEETRQLSRLVEDLRTLSLAEAGQLPLVWEPVDVAELLADVRTSFSGQAEAAELDLRVEIEGALPAIAGDVGRLDQVLGNLAANAIRHTPAGGSITLRAKAVKDRIRILVRDTGVGIPAEDLPYVFDRFWKGDRARTRAGGSGSGLGLAIARQLVQAHGGRIGVESEPGQGTTFIIELPMDQADGTERGHHFSNP